MALGDECEYIFQLVVYITFPVLQIWFVRTAVDYANSFDLVAACVVAVLCSVVPTVELLIRRGDLLSLLPRLHWGLAGTNLPKVPHTVV